MSHYVHIQKSGGSIFIIKIHCMGSNKITITIIQLYEWQYKKYIMLHLSMMSIQGIWREDPNMYVVNSNMICIIPIELNFTLYAIAPFT